MPISALELAMMIISTAKPALPRIGILWFGTAEFSEPSNAALRQGLRELGYADGENLIIDARFADGQFSTLGAIRLGAKPGESATPIIGSGAFRGQRGEVASTVSPKGYESADVLRID